MSSRMKEFEARVSGQCPETRAFRARVVWNTLTDLVGKGEDAINIDASVYIDGQYVKDLDDVEVFDEDVHIMDLIIKGANNMLPIDYQEAYEPVSVRTSIE